MKFEPMGKIPRYEKDIIITEKIDGINAQIYIGFEDANEFTTALILSEVGPMSIWAGSRNKWIIPGNDNFGFAAWVRDNAEELIKLGPGRHFGEWWGKGIQRGYGLDKKRFSLFNVSRWNEENKPVCCHLVPVLYKGPWENKFPLHRYSADSSTITQTTVYRVFSDLAICGSYAAPGYMNPEGIVIYHTGGNYLFKKTFKKDGGKWQ
jgi:hypothetical protein